MNELNYASREASQKLVDRGIVLEADFYWVIFEREETIRDKRLAIESCRCGSASMIPAPSMAEVWRELPLGARLYRGEVMSESYMANRRHGLFLSENPTDALIDLLIWQKGEKG